MTGPATGGRVLPEYQELDLQALLNVGGGDSGELDGQAGHDVDDPAADGPEALGQYLASVPDEKDVYHKPERVRAARAGTWIESPTKFIQDVYTAVFSTREVISLLHYLLKDQMDASWTGAQGLDVTLVQWTMPSRSPAVRALDGYYEVMDLMPDDLFYILHGASALIKWIRRALC